MNRNSFLKKLNSINMEIGRLMQDAQTAMKQSGNYLGAERAEELAKVLMGGPSKINAINEKAAADMIASGYGTELYNAMSKNKDSINPRQSKIMERVNAMIDKYTKNKSKYDKEAATAYEKYAKKESDSNKSLTDELDLDKWGSVAKYAGLSLACFLISIVMMAILKVSVINEMKDIVSHLMNNDLSVANKMSNILAGVIKISVVLVPVVIGCYLLYKAFVTYMGIIKGIPSKFTRESAGMDDAAIQLINEYKDIASRFVNEIRS